MSSLYPDESYCTSEVGRILYQLKTDWTCKSSIIECKEEKYIAGSFTLYTVEITCTPVASHLNEHPERSFQLITRFKEMQKLHGALAKLHKQLYLRGTFPVFPPAKIIGNNAPEVIQERRLAIENLLNFTFDSEVLRKAKILHEFVEKARERAHTAHELTAGEILYDNLHSILDQPVGSDDQSVLTPSSSPLPPQQNQQNDSNDFQFPDVPITSTSSSTSTTNEKESKTSAMKRLFPKFRANHNANIGGVDENAETDYLVKAGQLVATAQRAEDEHAYELAFQCYKNAASSLIQGVQIESDMTKRNAVRRKTAKYLVKAEKLYRTYLSLDGSVFNFEGLMTAAMQDPNIMAFQCSNKSMKNYRFIGVLPNLEVEKKVLLVEEKSGENRKFVMKLLEKGQATPESRIFLPTNIPHMVQLVQFFETEMHIILLLEYIEPGRLWSFLSNFFDENECKYLMELGTMKMEVRHGEQVEEVIDGQKTGKGYRGRRLLFTVGVDFERVVEMRDQTTSSDIPSEDTLVCDMGVDVTGKSKSLSGDFTILEGSKEDRESKFFRVAEESPATIQIKKEKPVGAEGFLMELSKALKAVQHQLSLRRRVWNHLDLPECLITHWSAQIVSFFFVMHAEHFEFVGDLNTDNILIDRDGNIMITYIGKWYETNCRYQLKDGYSAPESCEYGWIPSAESDIWTIGALMFELLCGRSLANCAPHGILRNMELPYPDQSNVSFEAKDILSMILVPLAISRPSIDDIRTHPFFRHIDWRLYDNPTQTIKQTPSTSSQT